MKEKDDKHAEAAKKREERRNQAFIPPEEPKPSTSKPSTSSSTKVDIAALKEKIAKAKKKPKKTDFKL